jgi:oligosaccharide repeat unit polymerase
MMTTLGFEAGRARDFTAGRLDVRPLYNVWSAFHIFLSLASLAYAFIKPSRTSLLFVLLCLGLAFFSGTRMVTIWPMMLFLVVLSIAYPRQLGWKQVSGVVSVLLIVGWGVGVLRTDPGHRTFNLMSELLYSGNLSDLRDFALVLWRWDNVLYYGKTYAAALLTFIPQYISDFRRQYGLGRVTCYILGYDPNIHAGVRVTMFGEVYLNFGMTGVILLGLAYGLVVFSLARVVDAATHGRTAAERVAIATCGITYLDLIANWFNTAGFFRFYGGVLLIILGLFISWSTGRRPSHAVEFTASLGSRR